MGGKGKKDQKDKIVPNANTEPPEVDVPKGAKVNKKQLKKKEKKENKEKKKMNASKRR
jgi:hypothetical protein